MARLADFMDRHAPADRDYLPSDEVSRHFPSDKVSRYETRPPRVRLANSGPNSRRIARAAGRPELAEQVLASLFWWCYVRTPEFRLDSRGIGFQRDSQQTQVQSQSQIIVSHDGDTRRDLLVLAPKVRETFGTRVRSPKPGVSSRSAISAVAVLERDRMRAMVARAGIEIDGRSVVLAVTELADRGDFRLVVAGSPGETPTHVPTTTEATLGSFVAPAPALPVTISGNPNAVATAGVIGADEAGRTLVITARHAVTAASAKATRILIGGAVAIVVGCDELTDSCLLSVTHPAGAGAGRAGLLRFAPAEHRPATFDGAASGHKETRIRGYDLSVLDPSPYLSSKVYTDPDTVPGDSGTALIDSEDHIIGFAVSRTAFGAPLEFSTWSWAEQVLAAHGLA